MGTKGRRPWWRPAADFKSQHVGRLGADRWAATRSGRVGWTAAVVGALVTLVVFGLALARANRTLDVSDNLVFSSRHLATHKHFVRCRVDAVTGALDLFVVGTCDPGTGWEESLARSDDPPPFVLGPHVRVGLLG